MPKGNSDLSSGLLRVEEMAIQKLALHINEAVHHHVCRNNGQVDDVFDVLQETLTRVLLNLRKKKISPSDDLKAYAIKIARNVWHEKLRLKKKEGHSHWNPDAHNAPDISLEEIENKHHKDTLHQVLYQALDKLDKPCQELVERAHLNKEKLKAIAHEKGIPYNNLRFKMHYCMKKLRKIANEILDSKRPEQ